MAAQQRDVAFASATGVPPRRSGPQVLTDSELAALLAAPERDEVEVGGAYCHRTSVAAGGQHFGTLTLARPEPISFEDKALLRRAAPVLALILAAQAAAENELWRDRGAVAARRARRTGRRTRSGQASRHPGEPQLRGPVLRPATGTRSIPAVNRHHPCTPGLGPSRGYVVSRRRRPGRHLPCGRSRPHRTGAPELVGAHAIYRWGVARRLAGFESSAVPCVRPVASRWAC